MIYLDSAATTLQKPRQVREAMARAVGTLASPGRGGYRASMAAADTAFRCRELAAELFDVPDPGRVVLTYNATHGLNLAIRTLARPGMRVVISGYEHNAVTRPLYAIGTNTVAVPSPLFAPDEAAAAFERAITRDTGLVILCHVSNVFGTVLPAEAIGEICKKRRIPMILDASQSAGVLPVKHRQLGAAFIAMPGHKGLYGPQGTGLLLCAEDPKPILYGGTGTASVPETMPSAPPESCEAGTHNMPGIAGLEQGLRFIASQKKGALLKKEQTLVEYAARRLGAIPGVTVYAAENAQAQAGVLSFRLEGMAPESTAEKLAEKDICVRAGMHCAPLAHRTGGTFPEGTVRMSVSAFNRREDIDALTVEVGRMARGRDPV